MHKTNLENKTYYIIGKEYITDGLFALYIWICAQIIYAKKNGFIPVVDMQHHKNQFFKDNREYRDNVWEYFFEQPENVSLKDIPEDAPIKIAGNKVPDIEHLWASFLPLSKVNQVDPILADEYIRYLKPTPHIKEYLEGQYYEITKGNTNILGILARGTDYVNIKPATHPIQPNVEDIIKKAEELYDKYHYEKIWLATEDAAIYQKFSDKFGTKLLPNKQYKFTDTKQKYLCELSEGIKDYKYNLSRDYFLSMYILSKCRYFIGGRTSGTVAAYLLSNKFENQEYVYLWDLGYYKKEKVIVNNCILSIKNVYLEDYIRKIIKIFGIKITIKIKL